MTTHRRAAVMVIGLALESVLYGMGSTAHAAVGEANAVAATSKVDAAAERSGSARERRLIAGQALFNGSCAMCHGSNGTGMARLIPPLARSDFIDADPRRAVAVVVNGYRGRLKVNGGDYNAEMPRLTRFSDAEFADILTYVFNAWGNDWGVVTAEQVAAARNAGNGMER